MADILSNVVDNVAMNDGVYNVKVNNKDLCYTFNSDRQDVITGNRKRFFSLLPNSTEELFGYFHYHAFLNRHSKVAWLGHTALTFSAECSTTEIDIKGPLLIWEFYVDRLDRQKVGGILINLAGEGNVYFEKNIQTYLSKHKLVSDIDKEFNDAKAER